MEPVFGYLNLLMEQLWAVLSKVQHCWGPLTPSGGV